MRRHPTTGRTTVSAEQLVALVGALPEGYKEDYTPRQALRTSRR